MAEEKSGMQQLKDFFSTDEKPVTNKELIEFKKTDQAGYEKVRDAIVDGSLTY